jgi:hypothetical protein
MQTDIRILEVHIYFHDVHMRTALLFGRTMAPGARALPITVLTARILGENRAGKHAEGWGSMLLSPNWAFPSDLIAQEVRNEAMREVARRYAHLLSGWQEFAHPLVIALDTKADLLRLADDVSAEMGLAEPMAALAALNAASPLDCALHDAFGIAAGIDSYAGYGPDHCSFDLSRWLGPRYRRRHLSEYLLTKFTPRLPVWHVVGGGDKLTSSERDATDPQDGLPVSLDEWIERDGVYCFKVKLKGADLQWDVERTAAVAAVAEESLKKRGRREYFLSVDSNELCPDPEAVVEMLERLRERSPQAYHALLYVAAHRTEPRPPSLHHGRGGPAKAGPRRRGRRAMGGHRPGPRAGLVRHRPQDL